MSRAQHDQFIDDEEEETCPLCVEEFDLSDKNFRPCPCGYQICQFCCNNIRTTMNGLCPACRRPYDDKTMEWKQVTAEEQANYRAEKAQKEKKNALRQKEAQKKEADSSSRKHLAGIRVVQKNLVYVTGLQPTTREDRLLETLRGDQYFGQYGKIIKIVVSKGKEGVQHANQSVGIYVTFARKEDAERCIRAVDGSQNGDRILKAAYGTTKYCSAYIRNENCNNRNCMFLHEPGEENESFTRQDLSSMNVASSQQPNPTRPPQIPPQPAPQPVAAATQVMNRQESNEGRASPSVAGNDGTALPSTASWANKPAQQSQSRKATAVDPPVKSPSPAPPASTQEQLSESLIESAIEEEPSEVQEAPASPPAQKATPPAPKAKKTRKPKVPELDRVLKVLSTSDFKFTFYAENFTESERKFITSFPPLFDPNGGEKRAAMKEKLRQGRETAQAPLQVAPVAEAEDNPESGSLQLGGEPEERQDVTQARNQQHAIAPPSHQGLGNQNLNIGVNEDLANLGMQARGLTPQQQQQLLLLKSGSQASNLLNAFQGGQMSQQQQNQQSGTAPNHARQTSRFSFADSGNGATSVKSNANQKPGNQQGSMMNSGQFNQQSSMGNHFFSSGVQGPPPGLKATGTPPVSGGGMFGQGHGFATSGLGFGANAAARNANEEMMRDLLRGQRGGNIGGGQAGEADASTFNITLPPTDRSTFAKTLLVPFFPGLVPQLDQPRRGTPTIPPGFTASARRDSRDDTAQQQRTAGSLSQITPAVPMIVDKPPQDVAQGGKKPEEEERENTQETSINESKKVSKPRKKVDQVQETQEGAIASAGKLASGPLAAVVERETDEADKIGDARDSSGSPKKSRKSRGSKQKSEDTSNKDTKKSEVIEDEKAGEEKIETSKKTGSAKKQSLGKLDIVAATKDPVENKLASIGSDRGKDENVSGTRRASATSSLPPTPAAQSTGSPAKKTSKIIRVVQTPKTEEKPPTPALSSGVQPTTGRHSSRQPSVGSINLPGTPVSELVSDTASVTSASVSRANSPPPSKSASVSVRAKTKGQLKKERQERAKLIAEEKVDDVPPKIDEEPVQEPVIGRKKKTKKQPKVTDVTSETVQGEDGPASPPLPIESSVSNDKEDHVQATKVKSQRKSVGKIAPVSISQEPVQPPSPPTEHSTPVLPTAAAILGSLQEAGELLSQNLEFFKNVQPGSHRSENFSAADLANRDRKIPLWASDLEQIFKLQTVHLGGDDNRSTSRAMVTPEGVLWNLSRELEERYVELGQRIKQSRPPTKYRHKPSASKREAAANAKGGAGVAVPINPTGSFLPSLTSTLRSAAMASKTQKLVAQIAADMPPGSSSNDQISASTSSPEPGSSSGASSGNVPGPPPKILDDTAMAYLNQWVMPTDQPIGSSTRGETAAVGAPGLFASHATVAGAPVQGPYHGNISPGGSGSTLSAAVTAANTIVGGGITLAEMEQLGAFAAELLDGYIVQGATAAGLDGAASVDDVEKEMVESRRHAEKLEKQLNALVKRNRKLAGGH